ncbi:aldehyde dehydrogenase [Ascobolus immersus RN42]|uniref:Aldehyde dehydrogenase n=1 Tax=Ascobolus immersus RN42 TaxID=1160509 RepID=A0A3N4IFN2_ASCIM|nr:aldehyde dehydrogenase [Ascobolus immersus RN42]
MSSPAEVRPDPTLTIPLLLPAEFTSSKTFPIFSPLDRDQASPLWQCSSAGPEQVDAAITASTSALRKWSSMPYPARRDILLKAATLIEENGPLLAKLMEIETGAPNDWTMGFNVPVGAALVREVAGRIKGNSGEKPLTELVWTEPVGVVLGIAPWNAPIVLGLRSILYPLAAGCTVVFKGSERCPRTHHLMVQLLLDAGLPEGAVTMVLAPPGDPEGITKRIIQDKRVKKINFTGSTKVGSLLAAEAGKHLKPVLMELGGKAALLVLEDADLDLAVEEAVRGAFMNVGQICMSTERVILQESVASQFREKLKLHLKNNPPPSGPLISPAALDSYLKLVTNAIDSGAIKFFSHPTDNIHAPPTILTDVTPQNSIFHTESFAPLLCITTFKTLKEGLELMNESEYGLSASIFSKDLGKALRIARRVESGSVHINGGTVHDSPLLPHGGVKGSGWGRFGGSWGVREFTTVKVVTFRG